VGDIAALDYMIVGTRVVSCAEEGWINTKTEIQTRLPAAFSAEAMNQSAYRPPECSNGQHRIRCGRNLNESGQLRQFRHRQPPSTEQATVRPAPSNAPATS
jgi:hypothetical protein